MKIIYGDSIVKATKVVVVLPTYNESKNIKKMINALSVQREQLHKQYDLQLLVVDDLSPDGTGDIVKKNQKKNHWVHLLSGNKAGLGVAYKRGFAYAIKELKADILIEMDADFSHNPNDLPRLVKEITKGFDFVIGSRYVKGGSIPADWPLFRKLNSWGGNLVARVLAGIKGVKDTTGGYRAIKASVIKGMDLDKLQASGYAFQVTLLFEAQRQNAEITEIPIKFTDRVHGNSKMALSDILEFIYQALFLRLSTYGRWVYITLGGLSIFIALLLTLQISLYYSWNLYTFFIYSIAIASIVFTLQGIFTLFWMVYAWEDLERVKNNKSPEVFSKPQLSFTALIPARNEQEVLQDTIKAIVGIDYPASKKEIMIVCRKDDEETIRAAKEVKKQYPKENIVLLSQYLPENKPEGLNLGLEKATKDVIVIFDAEDEPNKDIYNVVNTVFLRDNVDVVQSGVQLMNYRSNWFSTLNVLEYYFWFKSALHYFANQKVIPLGGNTVFFKKDKLDDIGGWDETCLTEDADIGFRMSLAGARLRIIYDENHTTQEETPPTLNSFIKQRTRWSQGFIQILLKGDWLKFPRLSQKLLAGYLLIIPEIQALMSLYVLFSLGMMFFVKLPVMITIITIFPLFMFILQFITLNIGLYEFTKDYKLKFSPLMPLKLLITAYPYQFILGIASLRAIVRMISHNVYWEKTEHVNAHRDVFPLQTVGVPSGRE